MQSLTRISAHTDLEEIPDFLLLRALAVGDFHGAEFLVLAIGDGGLQLVGPGHEFLFRDDLTDVHDARNRLLRMLRFLRLKRDQLPAELQVNGENYVIIVNGDKGACQGRGCAAINARVFNSWRSLRRRRQW